MTDIIVTTDRATTKGPVSDRIHSLRRQFEGSKSLLKNGGFAFVPSAHNLSLWAFNFPDSAIEDQRLFESFAPSNPLGIRPKFELKREPMEHQSKAFQKLKTLNSFGLFYDPGAGKSKSLTDLAVYHWCEGTIDAMIIWTPNALVSQQWTRRGDPEALGQLERDIHDTIPWDVWLWGKSKKAENNLKTLKNFNGLQVIVMNIDAGKTPVGQEILEKFINQHKGRVLFAIDESHFIKTKTSGRAIAAMKFGAMCSCRAILTGTPIGKDLLDLWSQFLFLDERIIGIRYKTAFMNAYCVTRHNGFGLEVIGHKNVDKLFNKIEPFVYRVTQAELGLRKLTDEFEFIMHEEQKAHYKSLKETFITQLDNGDFMTSANAISAMTRMQQVSNGYLVREDGSFQTLPNARLEALQAWIETISDDKLVIWCRFKNDAKLILDALGKECIDISGNVTKEVRIRHKDLFISDPKFRFVVGTPDAAGTGVDGLQEVCNRAVRYSLSYNLILHDQAENRTSRIGGTGTAFYTDIIGKGTLDRKILRNLSGKKDLSSLALDDIRKMVME